MSKRTSNKKSPRRTGVVYGRERVRLGWRKRLLRELRIAAAIQRAAKAAGLEVQA